MSTLIVEVVEIDAVEIHPNADRLDIVKVKGWQCVAGRGQYQAGDKAVYIPIDSILPMEVESALFGPDSKVKLSKSRVKTIRLRGAISQGMVATLDVLGLKDLKIGTDVTNKLGITKYEPPKRSDRGVGNMLQTKKKGVNPHFKKYTGIENIKNYPRLFSGEDMVVVTEKVHGTNFRCGWVPWNANTWWKKVMKFFGITPEFEFVYGSHNVQLQSKLLYTGYYDQNVYSQTVERYNLKELIPEGYVLYGEIYGEGIQKGYTYGRKADNKGLVVFDIMYNGEYLNHMDMWDFCYQRNIPMAPIRYIGVFDLEYIRTLATGPSILAPSQKVIEGVVVKSAQEQGSYMGRKVLKLLNDKYLLKDQTEFH